jgi:hypothetical protein
MSKVIYKDSDECKNAKFVGIFFDDASIKALTKYADDAMAKFGSKKYRKDYSKVYSRLSMVYQDKKDEKPVDIKKAGLGKAVSVEVIGYGENTDLQVLYLKLPSGVKAENTRPYIMLSKKKRTSPYVPITLWDTAFKKMDFAKLKTGTVLAHEDTLKTKFFKGETITLKGKIGAYCADDAVAKEEKKIAKQERLSRPRKTSSKKRKTSTKRKTSSKKRTSTKRKTSSKKRKTSSKKRTSRKTSTKKRTSRKTSSKKRTSTKRKTSRKK